MRYYVRSKIVIGVLLLTLGASAGGLEGLLLAAMAAVLLAIPGRKSKRYAIRFVA